MELPFDPNDPTSRNISQETRNMNQKGYIHPYVFIEAQFTIAKIWKQLKCPSANEWINKLWYIYTMEYYAAVKKFLPFAIAWMELKSIMLSEIRQSEKDKYYIISLIYGI